MAVTPETLRPAALRLYESVRHLEVAIPEQGYDPADEGWPWATMCAALAAPVEDLYAILALSETPWGPALDAVDGPDLTLPWLANFAGVDVEGVTSMTELRKRIRERPARMRGGPQALRTAVEEELRRQHVNAGLAVPSEFHVVIFERYGSPTSIHVATPLAETPEVVATAYGDPTNLVADPDFKGATGKGGTGWAVSATAGMATNVKTATNVSHEGSDLYGKSAWRYQLVNANDATVRTLSVFSDSTTPYRFPVTAGETYGIRLGSFVESLVGSPEVALRIAWYAAGPSLISTDTAVWEPLVGGDNVHVVASTAPATATTARLLIEVRLNAANEAVDLYMAQALVVKGGAAAAQEHFSGADPLHRWAGDPNASASESGVAFASDAVYRAALAATRAGLRKGLTTAIIAGGTYETLASTHADYAEVLTDFPTYAAVLTDPSAT